MNRKDAKNAKSLIFANRNDRFTKGTQLAVKKMDDISYFALMAMVFTDPDFPYRISKI